MLHKQNLEWKFEKGWKISCGYIRNCAEVAKFSKASHKQ